MSDYATVHTWLLALLMWGAFVVSYVCGWVAHGRREPRPIHPWELISPGFQPMRTAPRDGSLIEIAHISGWTDFYRWVDRIDHADGGYMLLPRHQWVRAGSDTYAVSGIGDEANFRWRAVPQTS
jgi:hypothetical protein